MENNILVERLKTKKIFLQFVEGRNAGVIIPKDFHQAKRERFLAKHIEQVKTITFNEWNVNTGATQ